MLDLYHFPSQLIQYKTIRATKINSVEIFLHSFITAKFITIVFVNIVVTGAITGKYSVYLEEDDTAFT